MWNKFICQKNRVRAFYAYILSDEKYYILTENNKKKIKKTNPKIFTGKYPTSVAKKVAKYIYKHKNLNDIKICIEELFPYNNIKSDNIITKWKFKVYRVNLLNPKKINNKKIHNVYNAIMLERYIIYNNVGKWSIKNISFIDK